jgi:hypothetical protein
MKALVLLLLTACSSAEVQKTPQAEALDQMNEPFSNTLFQSVLCRGKVIPVFDKLDQGVNVLYLDETGHWLTFNKSECKESKRY